MDGILDPIERNRLSGMLSSDKWRESEGDILYAARLLFDFGYISTPKETAYFIEHPQKREYQLREILEMD